MSVEMVLNPTSPWEAVVESDLKQNRKRLFVVRPVEHGIVTFEPLKLLMHGNSGGTMPEVKPIIECEYKGTADLVGIVKAMHKALADDGLVEPTTALQKEVEQLKLQLEDAHHVRDTLLNMLVAPTLAQNIKALIQGQGEEEGQDDGSDNGA